MSVQIVTKKCQLKIITETDKWTYDKLRKSKGSVGIRQLNQSFGDNDVHFLCTTVLTSEYLGTGMLEIESDILPSQYDLFLLFWNNLCNKHRQKKIERDLGQRLPERRTATIELFSSAFYHLRNHVKLFTFALKGDIFLFFVWIYSTIRRKGSEIRIKFSPARLP